MGILQKVGSFLVGGKKKGTSSNETDTSQVDPYAPTIPYLNNYLSQTSQLYNGGAPQFSPMEQSGYAALNGVAGDQGSLNGAIAQNDATINGQYLTPDTNPYLSDIAQRISGIAGANANATFGGKGRSSGGLAGYYSGKATTDSLTDLYGQEYDNERGRQQQAIGQAPGLDAARYTAPQALITAGQNVTARPYDLNQQYGGIISQIAGLGKQGTSTADKQNYVPTNGLFGDIFNSGINKVFGTTRGTG